MSEAAASGYAVDLLAQRRRRGSAEAASAVDERPLRRRRRSGKSPMTAQVHAWVKPDTREEIQHEAEFHDTTQGVIISRAWEHYKDSGLAIMSGVGAAGEGD